MRKDVKARTERRYETEANWHGLVIDERTNGHAVMHYSRHHLTASVAYMTMRTRQLIWPMGSRSRPFFSSSKTEPCQFSYAALWYAPLGWIDVAVLENETGTHTTQSVAKDDCNEWQKSKDTAGKKGTFTQRVADRRCCGVVQKSKCAGTEPISTPTGPKQLTEDDEAGARHQRPLSPGHKTYRQITARCTSYGAI